MLLTLICILIPHLQQDIPYKPDEEFEIKMDLSFKQRPMASTTEVRLNETRAEHERRMSASPVPYLKLTVIINQIGEHEARLKVVRDRKDMILGKRKLQPGIRIELDMGFVDDVKDSIKGFHHVITFYDDKKNEVSRIVIEFDSQGNYLVNGEKRGRV